MRRSFKSTVNWNTTFKETLDEEPMATPEFRELCRRLKINDALTASKLLGPSWRTCQRYWHAEAPIPPPVARLLRLAARHCISHGELLTLAKP